MNSSCAWPKTFEVELKNIHESSQFNYFIQYWDCIMKSADHEILSETSLNSY